MNVYKEGVTFPIVLGDYYQFSIATINLVKLMNDLKKSIHIIYMG
jgi:hypothetical protein